MTQQHSSNFHDLSLCEPLLKALQQQEFLTPSPIQAQAIPHLLTGCDLVGLAQTGTGKTAAFGLPILHRLFLSNTTQSKSLPKALILTPTRELAIQIAMHIEKLGAFLPKLTITVLCGGQDYRPQLKQLKAGSPIVVGTPGRVLDHLERGSLVLSELDTLVLDEADEMLRMGFIEDVETVMSTLPKESQKALFSATMPTRIRQIAQRFLSKPVNIEIKAATATVKNIEQRFLIVPNEHKPQVLHRILMVETYQAVIIFVRTKGGTEELASFLQQQGIQAIAMHGDITQKLRERIIQQFKQGSIDVLVATDVAARGLDVDRITHVINYDIVTDCETYVHRIGRTGRAGRSGISILFSTPREGRMVTMIERHTRQPITKMAIPTDQQIQQAHHQTFIERITQRLTHEHFTEYRDVLEQHIRDHQLSALDVAAALAVLSQKDNSLIPSIAILPEVHDRKQKFSTSRRDNSRHSNGDYHHDTKRFSPQLKLPRNANREKNTHISTGMHSSYAEFAQALYRIDVGRMHGVKPGNIVGAIANEAGINSRMITGLKILDDHSTVRLPSDMPKATFQRLSKAWVCGRQMNLTSLGMG